MAHIANMDIVCPTLAFIDGLGGPEMMLIFVLVLVLFGGQKLPEFARGLGKSIREFKKAAAGVEEEFKRALEDDERKQSAARLAAPPAVSALPPAPSTTPAAADPHYDEYYDYSDSVPPEPTQTVAPAASPDTAAPVPETTPDGEPVEKPAASSGSPAPAVTPAAEPEQKSPGSGSSAPPAASP